MKNGERILILGALVAYTVFSVVVAAKVGVNIFGPLLGSWEGKMVLADLAVAFVLTLVWMWRDAKALGRNPWPWVVLTVVGAWIGPLTYLLARPRPGGSSSPS